MPNGYHGKILHVDLTAGTLEIEEPDERFYRTYMGGSALGLYYLLKFTPPGTDPLAPENTLTLASSVLTGVPIAGQSRITAVARSPLTEAVGDSQSGGFWPAEFKFTGFDAVVIRGRSEKPVYLWIHNGEAELRDASHLWGRITHDVETAIREELGDKRIEVLQCGPAGEKGVRFAAMINMSNRANGRTGMGAVMGSKNLKAIAVRGKQRPALADKTAVQKLAKWGAVTIPETMAGMTLLGTTMMVRIQNKRGGLPTYNYDSGIFEGYDKITGERMRETILKGNDSCYACAVRCKRVVEVKDGPYQVDPVYGGPEYETLATFGSYCGVDNLEAIAAANQICNQYGMDTISCGATIAWAMNAFEEGILTTEDTGGLELRYGNADAMVRLTEMIARREGFGDLLAEGSARAAAHFGPEAEALTITVKKQEIPAHMPQVKPTLGLIYAVNPFGADHQSSEHDGSYTEYNERMASLGLINPQSLLELNAEKVRYALYTEWFYSVLDTLDLCQFVFGPDWQLYGPSQLVALMRAVTGWEVSLWELQKLGERRLNMLRAFNAREGIGREQDTLPRKFAKKLVGGKSDGLSVDMERLEWAKNTYYAMAGWNVEKGIPTRAKLEELELGWIADQLEEAGVL